jgi:UPF0755 protein
MALVLALLVPAAGTVLWLRIELATPFYAGGTETFVDIARGAGTATIAQALAHSGILHAKLPFTLYVRWNGVGRRLKAGEYRFTAPARPAEIVGRLLKGDVYYRTLTVPEGLTARETMALIAQNGLAHEPVLVDLIGRVDWIADLAPQAKSLEGFLFPETYRFSRHASAEEIVNAMIAQFRSRTAGLLAPQRLPAGWTIAQIVTLASLIEKEARNDEERRLVASVLINRLRARMTLGCDPTIIYALKLAGRFDGNLRKADLALPSPYNTYINPGLPPGPIANPGIPALQAALSPAASDYYYYVARNDGTHQFSKDLRSHQLAVSRFQK